MLYANYGEIQITITFFKLIRIKDFVILYGMKEQLKLNRFILILEKILAIF